MKTILEALAGNYQWYKVRRQEYATNAKIPFRISPEPLYISKEEVREVEAIGTDVTQFVQAVDELYKTDETVRNLLNTGKPEIFCIEREAHYLFVRPDLIMTKNGFSICELETSPFGLGLAELLNRAYRQAGFETLAQDEALTNYLHQHAPGGGTIVYTPKTESYAGQLAFLADRVLSNGKPWTADYAANVQDEGLSPTDLSTIYRGFYLSEYLSDPHIKMLLENRADEKAQNFIPSLTPHLEEKAVLALLWDKRFESYFAQHLGAATVAHLRSVVPATWIVGQEQHFAPGLPNNMNSTIDLATMSRAKRTFVLKPSGFSTHSSWSEGVNFLHEKSAQKAQELIGEAQKDSDTLYVIQDFQKARDIPMHYENAEGGLTPMQARIRLTPYFSMQRGAEGELLTIKATGCENTDFIHGSTASITTAVAQTNGQEGAQ